ncbi:Extracellular membrane protein, CFEM domain [Penicillium griseofulvum]|uniref:Extracellular membrane protein, CFEM domain n=1 Tax=Penicillium patulum TaxID=5078 RepID=A0A135LMS2_PENPA|nr:Extracellular membrane protein, CFEM domain [Penicillium griseofulvum]KXG50239.1 Extracellular membrane protein, CFEM domain [Penicillium griseofulvum]
MRLSAAVVVLAAGAVARAQLSNIPQCSLTCFTSALGSDGCSELTDFACHCQTPGLVGEIVPCINESCDVPDRKAVSSIVDNLCSGVGHPISITGVDTSAPITTGTGAVPTSSRSSNSTTTNSGTWSSWSSSKSTTTITSTISGTSPSTPTSSTVGGGSGSPISSSTNPGSPQQTPGAPEFNGASAIAPGAVQMVGSVILLASMVFFV